jgi:hypothetical protein
MGFCFKTCLIGVAVKRGKTKGTMMAGGGMAKMMAGGGKAKMMRSGGKSC